MDDLIKVITSLNDLLNPAGFECHPFKIAWYNEIVSNEFKLDYPGDTIAFIIISTPSMFEKSFKPFIKKKQCLVRDPIDECSTYYFQLASKVLPNSQIITHHDYEMRHNKKPFVLVQTAGHVAGAARYYQRSDIIHPPWPPCKKMYGVSIHPKYGGWFAFRGVLIFKTLICPDLPFHEPEDCVASNEDRIELLKRFNTNWEDWTFRDIIQVEERYSEDQKLYFATKPRDRHALINVWQ